MRDTWISWEKTRWEALEITKPTATFMLLIVDKYLINRTLFKIIFSFYSWKDNVDVWHPREDKVSSQPSHENNSIVHLTQRLYISERQANFINIAAHVSHLSTSPKNEFIQMLKVRASTTHIGDISNYETNRQQICNYRFCYSFSTFEKSHCRCMDELSLHGRTQLSLHGRTKMSLHGRTQLFIFNVLYVILSSKFDSFLCNFIVIDRAFPINVLSTAQRLKKLWSFKELLYLANSDKLLHDVL